MDLNWDFIFKIVTTFGGVGSLFALWKYLIERKERLLDKDFEKIHKLLCDDKFNLEMKENHLLRNLYYRNINYFNGIKNEVIDVVIKTQNRQINFNNSFYVINRFYHKNLLIVNGNQDGFLANIEKDKKLRYQPLFTWLMWVGYILFILLAVVLLVLVLKDVPIWVLYVPMPFIQFPLMNRQLLISDWKKFKNSSKHLLDNANEIP